MSNIQTVSRRLSFGVWLCLVLTPLSVIVEWHPVPGLSEFFAVTSGSFFYGVELSQLSFFNRCVGTILSMAVHGLLMLALYRLIQLLRLYAMGEVFSSSSVHLLQRMTKSYFLFALISVLIVPVISIAVTFDHGVGQRILALSFGNDDLYHFVFAGICYILAWVMKQGFELQQEQQLTV